MTDPATVYSWAPTVDDVARVSQNYTRGGFDDDDATTEGEPGTFTENTEPTASEVEAMILTACDEVASRAGATPLPVRCFTLAKTAAKWHVAMSIAADKAPQGTDDAASEYRSKNLNYINTLAELRDQARMAFGDRLR